MLSSSCITIKRYLISLIPCDLNNRFAYKIRRGLSIHATMQMIFQTIFAANNNCLRNAKSFKFETVCFGFWFNHIQMIIYMCLISSVESVQSESVFIDLYDIQSVTRFFGIAIQTHGVCKAMAHVVKTMRAFNVDVT